MRCNFRDVRDRFTHIDAQLVASSFTLFPPIAQVTVRLYPWWEHPLYERARDTGEPWGFRHVDGAARDMTVFAVNPREARLSQRQEIVDWAFCEHHPEAWRYEDEGEIFCNSDPDISALTAAVVARNMPFVTPAVLRDYLEIHGWTAPFSLGYFPYTLYHVVCEELERAGVRLHLPRAPTARPSPIVLVMEGEDFIIADDFELEVPDFEHRPEWFASQ